MCGCLVSGRRPVATADPVWPRGVSTPQARRRCNSQSFHGENLPGDVRRLGMMRSMSETPGPPNPPPAAASTLTSPPPAGVTSPAKPSKLYQATAWVVIVAGIVFIVATIFFSGFAFGRRTHLHCKHGHTMFQPGGPQMGGPPPGAGQWLFVFPGGPGGPVGPGGPGGMGGMGGMGPGGMGGMGPSNMPGGPSPSTTPSPAPRRP